MVYIYIYYSIHVYLDTGVYMHTYIKIVLQYLGVKKGKFFIPIIILYVQRERAQRSVYKAYIEDIYACIS